MNTDDPKVALALDFHGALAKRDWGALEGLVTEDATWSLPGENAVSGRAIGRDEVVARARKLAGYGVRFDLRHVLVGRDNVALSLHNTGHREGVVLDEQVAIVCRLRDSRIAGIETYLSDVAGMNAFFV